MFCYLFSFSFFLVIFCCLFISILCFLFIIVAILYGCHFLPLFAFLLFIFGTILCGIYFSFLCIYFVYFRLIRCCMEVIFFFILLALASESHRHDHDFTKCHGENIPQQLACIICNSFYTPLSTYLLNGFPIPR